MLDRIALGFAKLPQNYYTDAVLALPDTEEQTGEIDADYTELKEVLTQILGTMKPGGRLRIGQPKEEKVTKEAILAGFLVETDNHQVKSRFWRMLTI